MAITFKPERWKSLFIVIWSGQALSLIGSKFVSFALIWWLTVETGSVSVLATASLLTALLALLFLFGVALPWHIYPKIPGLL